MKEIYKRGKTTETKAASYGSEVSNRNIGQTNYLKGSVSHKNEKELYEKAVVDADRTGIHRFCFDEGINYDDFMKEVRERSKRAVVNLKTGEVIRW